MCHNYTYEALTTALQSLKYTNTHTSDVRTRIHTLFSTHKHTQAVCWLMELFFSLMSFAVVLLSTVPLITSVFTRFFPLFSALLHLCLPLHLLLFYCVLLSFFHSYFHLIVSNSNRGTHVMCSPVAVFFLPLFPSLAVSVHNPVVFPYVFSLSLLPPFFLLTPLLNTTNSIVSQQHNSTTPTIVF